MPRPTTKETLLALSQQEYETLNSLLAGYSDDELCQAGAVGTWSAKDVLAHLHAWQRMALGWMADNQAARKPEMPATGYKWSQIPALNQAIFEEYRNHNLADIQALLDSTHGELMRLIESLSQEQLYIPGHFKFTGKNNLATYLISATSSHYLWARTETRKGLRRLFPTP